MSGSCPRSREINTARAAVEEMIWVLTAYFGIGVLANAASRSRPERLVMTPVALVLALCCLVIALEV
jgi:hypothetical protein